MPRRAVGLSYDAYRDRTFFPVLDGIRAVAVLVVVASHIENSDVFGWFQGSRGVLWFFALSGFLITTLGLREEERRGSLAVRPFFIRRAFRILPLYGLALAAFVTSDVIVFKNAELTDGWAQYWPYYVTLLQDVPFNLGWDNVPFQVAWSLGVEEKFYLVWPFVGFVLLRGWRRIEVSVALAAGLATILLAWPGSDVARLLAPYLPILLGCVGAIILHDRSNFDRLSGRGTAAFAAALGLVVAVPWPESAASASAYPAVYALLVAATIAAFAATANAPVLGSPAMLWIGKRSYAIYLFHTLAIRVVSKGVARTPLEGELAAMVEFVVGLLGVLVLADVLHRFVEQPLIRRGRRLSASAAKGGPPLVIDPAGGLT